MNEIYLTAINVRDLVVALKIRFVAPHELLYFPSLEDSYKSDASGNRFAVCLAYSRAVIPRFVLSVCDAYRILA